MPKIYLAKKEYMNKLVSIALIAPLFLLAGCQKEGFFNAGKTVTQRIELNNTIADVTINSMFEITLVQDTENYALVTCGENLQPEVNLSSKENSLLLSHSIIFNWTRSYEKVKVELHLKELPSFIVHKPVLLKTKGVFKGEQFSITGRAAYAEVDVNIDASTCSIDMGWHGFGLYKISGKATEAKFYCYGSARIEAQSLETEKCKVVQSSIDNVYVTATNALEVLIEKSGNVYYTGNPTITYSTSSSGKLIKR